MRQLASIQTVNAAEAIPTADAIERIRVLGWWVVVKKGEFRPGDRVVYCELVEEYDKDLGGRLSFKVINPRFLLKHDE